MRYNYTNTTYYQYILFIYNVLSSKYQKYITNIGKNNYFRIAHFSKMSTYKIIITFFLFKLNWFCSINLLS